MPAFVEGVTVATATSTVSHGEVTFVARTAGAAHTALNFAATESSLATHPLVVNSGNSLFVMQSSLTVTVFATAPTLITPTPVIGVAYDTSGSATATAPVMGMEYDIKGVAPAEVSIIGMEYESEAAVLPLLSFTVTASEGGVEYEGAS